MDNKIRVLALGGLDERGKDCYAIEIDDDIFVINAGMKEPDKTAPGVDFIIAKFDYLLERKNRIRAYILTHGHDSKIGALPYLFRRAPAPVYCTDITRLFLTTFCEHYHIDIDNIDYHLIEPSSEHIIANRKFCFFQTAHNMARSFGVAIDTLYGNIVFVDDFVIDHNLDHYYTHDARRMVKISDKETLLLMCESAYADRLGYTSPKFKIEPLIQRTLKDAPGRVFMAIDATDLYNIQHAIELGVKCGRKIIAYDKSTLDKFNRLKTVMPIEIPPGSIGSIENLNGMKEREVFIMMTGFGQALFDMIALLATNNNDDLRIKLEKTDTFIISSAFSYATELIATKTLDDLYHTDCHIVTFSKHEFLRMHASQEDLKTIISLFRPKYYLPITGSYRNMLANAIMAIDMGVGLNDYSVFVMDNGESVVIENGKAHLDVNKVVSGELLIDGKGIGDMSSKVLEERQRLSDDGVVVMGATISKSKRVVVAGPDTQMRGFVYLKDSEVLLREVNKIFIGTIQAELTKEFYSLYSVSEIVGEACSRLIRRETGKTPMIIPLIKEID